MQNILEPLTHYRQANSLLKHNQIEELELVINNLSKILNNKKIRESALQEKHKERNEKLAVYREMLAEDDININDLAAHISDIQQQKKATRPAKYAYTDESGKKKTWTGQGRTPNYLLGKSLEDFLI